MNAILAVASDRPGRLCPTGDDAWAEAAAPRVDVQSAQRPAVVVTVAEYSYPAVFDDVSGGRLASS
jgi:hypothetical protein